MSPRVAVPHGQPVGPLAVVEVAAEAPAPRKAGVSRVEACGGILVPPPLRSLVSRRGRGSSVRPGGLGGGTPVPDGSGSVRVLRKGPRPGVAPPTRVGPVRRLLPLRQLRQGLPRPEPAASSPQPQPAAAVSEAGLRGLLAARAPRRGWGRGRGILRPGALGASGARGPGLSAAGGAPLGVEGRGGRRGVLPGVLLLPSPAADPVPRVRLLARRLLVRGGRRPRRPPVHAEGPPPLRGRASTPGVRGAHAEAEPQAPPARRRRRPGAEVSGRPGSALLLPSPRLGPRVSPTRCLWGLPPLRPSAAPASGALGAPRPAQSGPGAVLGSPGTGQSFGPLPSPAVPPSGVHTTSGESPGVPRGRPGVVVALESPLGGQRPERGPPVPRTLTASQSGPVVS